MTSADELTSEHLKSEQICIPTQSMGTS